MKTAFLKARDERSKKDRGSMSDREEDVRVYEFRWKMGDDNVKTSRSKDAKACWRIRRGFYLESRFRPISGDVSSTRK